MQVACNSSQDKPAFALYACLGQTGTENIHCCAYTFGGCEHVRNKVYAFIVLFSHIFHGTGETFHHQFFCINILLNRLFHQFCHCGLSFEAFIKPFVFCYNAALNYIIRYFFN